MCRAYLENDVDLAIEAVFPNLYDKTAFGVFINAFNDDIRLIFMGEQKIAIYLR